MPHLQSNNSSSYATTHQLLLLHRTDHDGASLRVGSQVLPWDDPTAASLAECLDVHRLQLPAPGKT